MGLGAKRAHAKKHPQPADVLQLVRTFFGVPRGRFHSQQLVHGLRQRKALGQLVAPKKQISWNLYVAFHTGSKGGFVCKDQLAQSPCSLPMTIEAPKRAWEIPASCARGADAASDGHRKAFLAAARKNWMVRPRLKGWDLRRSCFTIC